MLHVPQLAAVPFQALPVPLHILGWSLSSLQAMTHDCKLIKKQKKQKKKQKKKKKKKETRALLLLTVLTCYIAKKQQKKKRRRAFTCFGQLTDTHHIQ